MMTQNHIQKVILPFCLTAVWASSRGGVVVSMMLMVAFGVEVVGLLGAELVEMLVEEEEVVGFVVMEDVVGLVVVFFVVGLLVVDEEVEGLVVEPKMGP